LAVLARVMVTRPEESSGEGGRSPSAQGEAPGAVGRAESESGCSEAMRDLSASSSSSGENAVESSSSRRQQEGAMELDSTARTASSTRSEATSSESPSREDSRRTPDAESRRAAAQNKGEKKRSVSQLREALAEDGDDEGGFAPIANGRCKEAASERKPARKASSERSRSSSSSRSGGAWRRKPAKPSKHAAQQPAKHEQKGSTPPGAPRHRHESRDGRARSIKVVTQIDELADILDEAGAPALKASKAAILSGASEYIEQLQSRNSMLESEQCEIISRIVSVAAGANPAILNDEKISEQVDYRLVFFQSSVPMAVAASDGKILASNERFVAGVGAASQDDLLNRMLFDLVKPLRRADFFSCVGTLLRSDEPAPCGDLADALSASNLTMSITFVRPSSFAVSLVEPFPADPGRASRRIAGAAPILADVKRDLAVVQAAKDRAPPVALLVDHRPAEQPLPPEPPTGLEKRIIG